MSQVPLETIIKVRHRHYDSPSVLCFYLPHYASHSMPSPKPPVSSLRGPAISSDLVNSVDYMNTARPESSVRRERRKLLVPSSD